MTTFFDRSVFVIGFVFFDLANNVHTFDHLSENDVRSVQPRRDDCGNEELAAICVLTSVCHTDPTRTVVSELEVLVWEAFAIDALATHAVASGEVAALNHESLDDAMELGALVPVAFLVGAQVDEVLDRTGHGLAE